LTVVFLSEADQCASCAKTSYTLSGPMVASCFMPGVELSFSYWFHASNIVTVYRDGVSVESPLTIVVNATFQNTNGSWVALPQVSIVGATYTVTNASNGVEYAIRTGSPRPPSDYTLAGGSIVAGLILATALYKRAEKGNRSAKPAPTQPPPIPETSDVRAEGTLLSPKRFYLDRYVQIPRSAG